MVKVRESQILESSSKAVHITNDNTNTISNTSEEKSDKKYVRTAVYFEEFGMFISLFDIITVDKDMRFIEAPRPRWQYGITINKGIESKSINVVNKSVWYENEDYRDKRFNDLLAKLTDCGFKFINV